MSDLDGPVMVTMTFDSDQPVELARVLARYVVVSRTHPGCNNIDLCSSATTSGRFVVVQKWADAPAQRAHFDSADMVAMAQACRDLLRTAPAIDLLDPISAHDLA